MDLEHFESISIKVAKVPRLKPYIDNVKARMNDSPCNEQHLLDALDDFRKQVLICYPVHYGIAAILADNTPSIVKTIDMQFQIPLGQRRFYYFKVFHKEPMSDEEKEKILEKIGFGVFLKVDWEVKK